MKKIRKIIRLLFPMILLLLMCGCSTSEKEIANNVASVDPYFMACDLKLKDYKVTKRQTNDRDKTDFVWLDVSGENDDFCYSASYNLMYVKYNDGWHLDEINRSDYKYQVKNGPSIDAISAIVASEFDNISLISSDTDYSKNINTTRILGEKSKNIIKETYQISLKYFFSPEFGWNQIDREDKLAETNYDVLGEWL